MHLELVLLKTKNHHSEKPEHCNSKEAPACPSLGKPVHSSEDPAQPKKWFFKCCLSLLLNFSAPLPAFRGRQCRHVPLAGPSETRQGPVTLISVTLGPARAGPDTQGMSKRVGDSEGPWPEPCPAAPCPALVMSWGSQPACLTASSLSLTSSCVQWTLLFCMRLPLHTAVYPFSCLCPDCVPVPFCSPLSLNICL